MNEVAILSKTVTNMAEASLDDEVQGNDMTNPISNSDDIIDSRDVVERIKELEDTEERDEEEQFDALLALQEDAGGYSDWETASL